MNVTKLSGHVDENRRLSVEVPASVPPGPVTVLLVPEVQEDEKSRLWTEGIANEWADDLADSAQDIYTLSDGEPAHAP